MSYKLRPITKSELHPTKLSGASCSPLSGKSCTNVPRYMLEGEGLKLPLCGVHARVAKEQIERSAGRNPGQITDRAKRYRAQRNRPPGKRCTFCGSRQSLDIDHVDGNEANGEASNLMPLCRSCNVRKGITQARNRIGIRTVQFNGSIPSLRKFQHSALVLLGIEQGNAATATAAIAAKPPATRAAYAEQLAKNPPPDFKQYLHAVTSHQRGSHDAGGKIIHATPPLLRSEYAREIASIKSRRRGSSEVPF